jgi:hypothetical protein
MADLWSLLHERGVDLVLSAHDHHYERLDGLDAAGAPSESGIRSFIVGTGGGTLFPPLRVRDGSEVRNFTTFGVLKLSLYATGYAYEFVATDGGRFTDRGEGACR